MINGLKKARHSMGAHTIYRDGIVLDMKGFNDMKLDTSANLLLVGSGALWSKIIPYLDQYSKSIKVMQSNSSFSVGGSVAEDEMAALTQNLINIAIR